MDATENYDEGYAQEQEDLRLMAAKNARKKIEMDARALANRINLLENEEKKVLQKIDETKRKALNVMVIKKRNREHDDLKSDWETEKRMNLNWKKHNAEAMKEDLNSGLSRAQDEANQQSLYKAQQVKDNLQVTIPPPPTIPNQSLPASKRSLQDREEGRAIIQHPKRESDQMFRA